MKHIEIEISDEPITKTKEEFDTDHGNWLRQIREENCPGETIEQIANKLNITVESILRTESGHDVPLYEATKLLEYYDPDHCSCMLTRC